MAEITLVAEPGRATGSPESRRLRATGRIPGVIYGQGVASEPVSVDARELRQALSGEAGLNQLLSLKVEGTDHLALARVLQRHPVRNTVVHIDFLVVSRTEVISADVPIILVGEAKHVEQERGVVEHILQSLSINARPGDIPNVIEIDVSAMVIGDAVRVGDLALPAGVTTDIDAEETVVMAATSEVAAEADELEAEEAQAAAEAAEGSGGGSGAQEG